MNGPDPSLGEPVSAGSAPEAVAEASPPRRKRRRFGYWLRENIRQLAAPLLAILLIRQYGVELYKIPTGSMAPTLYGRHFQIACTRCGWNFPASPQQGETDRIDPSEQVRCANCGLSLPLGNFNDHGGDKILANKWIYQVRDPKRWEVVVFRFFDPDQRRYRNYIKRLVGLPGDKGLEIKNGDVWTNGTVLAKPAEVQEAVWIPVYDSRYENRWLPAWREGPGWEFDDAVKVWVCRSPDALAALEFSRPITNQLAYNLTEASASRDAETGNPVGDLRVSVDLEAPGREGFLEVAIREDGLEHVLHLDADPSLSRVFRRREGALHEEAPVPLPDLALPAGRKAAVSFANWDGRLQVRLDGDVVWEGAVDPASLPSGRPESSVSLACRGAGTRFHRVRIDRDLYYTQATGHPGPHGVRGRPVDVGEGRYFFLGDNSASSKDSRFWPADPGDPDDDQDWTISREKILGKASYAVLYVEFDWPWKIPWSKIRVKPVR